MFLSREPPGIFSCFPPENLPGIPGSIPGYFLVFSRNSRVFPGNLPRNSRVLPGNLPRSPREFREKNILFFYPPGARTGTVPEGKVRGPLSGPGWDVRDFPGFHTVFAICPYRSEQYPPGGPGRLEELTPAVLYRDRDGMPGRTSRIPPGSPGFPPEHSGCLPDSPGLLPGCPRGIRVASQVPPGCSQVLPGCPRGIRVAPSFSRIHPRLPRGIRVARPQAPQVLPGCPREVPGVSTGGSWEVPRSLREVPREVRVPFFAKFQGCFPGNVAESGYFFPIFITFCLQDTYRILMEILLKY